MPGDTLRPRDRRQAPARGAPPGDEADPVVPEARPLPPHDPRWRPGGLLKRITDTYGAELKRQPVDKTWFPHLLIRSAVNDTGARPLWPPTHVWLSPDLFVFPHGAPVDLAQSVSQPVAGRKYTVGVHIWNLGRFPAYGVAVRAWWVEPGFFTGSADPRYRPHFIGGTFTELGDRDSGKAHKIVAIPQPWTVLPEYGGHQCLFAVVEAFADPWTGRLAANEDRHVGQRNLSILAGAAEAIGLFDTLSKRLDIGDVLALSYGKVAAGRLAGAQTRGVSSSGEGVKGGGPLEFWPDPKHVVDLRKGPAGWTRAALEAPPTSARIVRSRTGPIVRTRPPAGATLGQAIRAAMGAGGTRAVDLLDGTTVPTSDGGGRPSSVALHLSARGGGYTVVVTR